MGRNASVVVLAAALALSLTACAPPQPAYSELSRAKVSNDELPEEIRQSMASAPDSRLLEETSRLVGTRNDVDYYLVLTARRIVSLDNRPSPAKNLQRSRNGGGVCIAIIAGFDRAQWGMGCGDMRRSEMGMGSTQARYLPPWTGDADGLEVPGGWVKLSDNLIVTE